MKVKELTQGEVIRMDLFKSNVQKTMDSHSKHIHEWRTKMSHMGVETKRQPIDRLKELNLWHVGSLMNEYVRVLTKKSELSTALRNEVKRLGNIAYNETMRKLIDDEKASRASKDNK